MNIEKKLTHWIEENRKEIEKLLKDPEAPLSKKVYQGENYILDALADYLSNLDINCIDEKESRKRAIFEIAEHFGLEHQMMKLEEELIELLHAVSRYNTREEHDYNDEQLIDDIIEELGDVKMLMKQVIWLLDVKKEVNTSIDDKILRTFNKMPCRPQDVFRLDLEVIRKNNP